MPSFGGRPGQGRRDQGRQTVQPHLLDQGDRRGAEPARRVDDRHAAGEAGRQRYADRRPQRLGDDGGFHHDRRRQGIDQEEAVTLALAHVPAAVVLDQGPDEGLVVAVGRRFEHAIDIAALEEMADARLPGNDRGVEPGAEHDGRRFGIAEDVELGGRGDIAAAVQRAAHDGEPADAAHDARRAPQRQREVGERADHQQIDRIGRGSRRRQRGGEELHGVRAGEVAGLGRTRRAAQPVLAMDVTGVDPGLDQRLGRARMHLDVRAGGGEDGQHVLRRRLEADVAVHRRDGVRRAAGGDQQQQRLGVVDAAVGIEDQSVCHGHVGSELRQTTHHRPSRSRSSRRRRR